MSGFGDGWRDGSVEECAAIVKYLLARAESHYAQAREIEESEPGEARLIRLNGAAAEVLAYEIEDCRHHESY